MTPHKTGNPHGIANHGDPTELCHSSKSRPLCRQNGKQALRPRTFKIRSPHASSPPTSPHTSVISKNAGDQGLSVYSHVHIIFTFLLRTSGKHLCGTLYQTVQNEGQEEEVTIALRFLPLSESRWRICSSVEHLMSVSQLSPRVDSR
jgi:hypothetical protein